MGKWVHRLSDIDTENRVAECSYCGVTKIYLKKHSNRWICRAQKRKFAGERNPETLRQSHGLTWAEATAFCKAAGRCAICGRTDTLGVDHCHTSGRIRGALCSACNIGLGHFRDDPELLRAAIDYLART